MKQLHSFRQGQDWGEASEAFSQIPCHQNKYYVNDIFLNFKLNAEIIQDEQKYCTKFFKKDKICFCTCANHCPCFSLAQALSDPILI